MTEAAYWREDVVGGDPARHAGYGVADGQCGYLADHAAQDMRSRPVPLPPMPLLPPPLGAPHCTNGVAPADPPSQHSSMEEFSGESFPRDSLSTPHEPESLPRESRSPNEPEVEPRGSHLTPRVPEYSPHEPEFTPHQPRFTPREPELTPHEPQFTPRESDVTPHEPQFTPRESELTPREPQFTPRESELTPREPQFTPRESELALREPQFTPRESQITPCGDDSFIDSETQLSPASTCDMDQPWCIDDAPRPAALGDTSSSTLLLDSRPLAPASSEQCAMAGPAVHVSEADRMKLLAAFSHPDLCTEELPPEPPPRPGVTSDPIRRDAQLPPPRHVYMNATSPASRAPGRVSQVHVVSPTACACWGHPTHAVALPEPCKYLPVQQPVPVRRQCAPTQHARHVENWRYVQHLQPESSQQHPAGEQEFVQRPVMPAVVPAQEIGHAASTVPAQSVVSEEAIHPPQQRCLVPSSPAAPVGGGIQHRLVETTYQQQLRPVQPQHAQLQVFSQSQHQQPQHMPLPQHPQQPLQQPPQLQAPQQPQHQLHHQLRQMAPQIEVPMHSLVVHQQVPSQCQARPPTAPPRLIAEPGRADPHPRRLLPQPVARGSCVVSAPVAGGQPVAEAQLPRSCSFAAHASSPGRPVVQPCRQQVVSMPQPAPQAVVANTVAAPRCCTIAVGRTHSFATPASLAAPKVATSQLPGRAQSFVVASPPRGAALVAKPAPSMPPRGFSFCVPTANSFTVASRPGAAQPAHLVATPPQQLRPTQQAGTAVPSRTVSFTGAAVMDARVQAMQLAIAESEMACLGR